MGALIPSTRAEWQANFQTLRNKQKSWKTSSKKLQPALEAVVQDVSLFSDVMDTGLFEPLCSKSSYEDWALLSIRYELHLLMHALRQNRHVHAQTTLPQAHLAAHYNKYFGKEFKISNYGFKGVSELAEVIKDTVLIEGDGECACLAPQLTENISFEHLVKLTEVQRRDQSNRIDAGDDYVPLKFLMFKF